MKTKNKLMFGGVLALAGMMWSAPGFAHGAGNGGDACELRIHNIREDLKKWIADGGATHLKLPATLDADAYKKKITDAITDAEVSCTSDKLTLKGAEKTCLNSVGGAVKITCNRDAFNATQESEQYVLIHHEYAGIAGIEVNAGAASDYLISKQLTSFLKDTVVKKLVIPSQRPLPGPVAGMEFVTIKPGKFWMGSCSQKDVEQKRAHCTKADRKRNDDETLHEVTLTKNFEMMTTEVTQKQWFLVMGDNPSEYKNKKHCPQTHVVSNGVEMCPSHPVERVSWEDVQSFIGRLSLAKNDGYTYRLPTEAEWEYAARAGTTTFYSFDPDVGSLDEYAWFSMRQTYPVAFKKANFWGLFDMHGNVWEWTSDLYQKDLGEAPVKNPDSPISGSYQVIRGGSWLSYDSWLGSATRFGYGKEQERDNVGFRLVRQ